MPGGSIGEAVGTEYVGVVDPQNNGAPRYLTLGELNRKYLFVREGELFKNVDVPVMAFEVFGLRTFAIPTTS